MGILWELILINISMCVLYSINNLGMSGLGGGRHPLLLHPSCWEVQKGTGLAWSSSASRGWKLILSLGLLLLYRPSPECPLLYHKRTRELVEGSWGETGRWVIGSWSFFPFPSLTKCGLGRRYWWADPHEESLHCLCFFFFNDNSTVNNNIHSRMLYCWIPEEGLPGQGAFGFIILIVIILQELYQCGPHQQCMSALFPHHVVNTVESQTLNVLLSWFSS